MIHQIHLGSFIWNNPLKINLKHLTIKVLGWVEIIKIKIVICQYHHYRTIKLLLKEIIKIKVCKHVHKQDSNS